MTVWGDSGLSRDCLGSYFLLHFMFGCSILLSES
nr:MAG TPA: hypothetical protein [Caudoviricetes sp.]